MNENIKGFSVILILSLAVISIYSNAFDASWHMDDKPNILNNYFLHLDSITLENLKNTLYTNTHNPYQHGDRMYRPVACLSFALNWYLGQDDVFGYHLVDIAIHILTAFFLFLFISQLIKAPCFEKKVFFYPVLIPLLASLLWAVNPIQTQAVTYIVQRMAQLAALFYIMAMYTYIKGKMSVSPVRKSVWFSSTLLFFLLAVFSKENAVMFPFAVLMIEVLFFQERSDGKVRQRIFFICIMFVILILMFGLVVFMKGNLLLFLDNIYSKRTFTLEERLLTEPRVLLFYISQIFYPFPERLSIAHDIVLSSSFAKPWTTIPSILTVIGIIVFALFQYKKRPLITFSILFFFFNHIIESSIIPLEIIFEHRNYLPAFFLFLPIVSIIEIFPSLQHKNRYLTFVTIFVLLSLVFCFSTFTYIRNKAWKNEITLWTDAVEKAPNNARALNTLAIKLAWGEESMQPKRYDMALKLFESSIGKHTPYKFHKADILSNMALIYFHQKQNYHKAIQLFKEALKISPGNKKIRRDFAEALFLMQDFDGAVRQVDHLIDQDSKNGVYYNLKGHILMIEKEYVKALSCFRKAYRLMAHDKTINKIPVLLNAAVALSYRGEYKKAEQMMVNLIAEDSENIICYLALIENSVRAESDLDIIEKYVKDMFKTFDEEKIKYAVENYTDNLKLAPISKKIIMPFIEPKFKETL